MEELIVAVSPTGQITMEVKGVKGSRCLERSRWLEDDLGVASHDRKTAEFYETEHVHEHLRHQN